MNKKLRLFIVVAILMTGAHSANAADNDNHSKGPIFGKCSDIVAGRETNDAAPAIGRHCDRNPENKLTLMVNHNRPNANPRASCVQLDADKML